jgi:formamidopyrimidine-DNA glycosylase
LMPELPEVEAARVLVHNHCKGKRIEQAIAADDTSESVVCIKPKSCHT